MRTNERKVGRQIGGLTMNQFAIPIIILFVLLHVLILFLFFSVSRESQQMSTIMQKSGEYTADATGLLAGSSKLSETATTYLLMPVTENGKVNVSSLFGYVEELKADRRGPQVMARFKKYDVSEEDRDYIAKAAEASDEMLDTQLHALALMNSVHPFSDISNLSTIPLPELTAKEKAYSDERKESVARHLVLGTEYALNKQAVSLDVNSCCGNLKKESAAKIAIAHARVDKYRIGLWTATLINLLLMCLMFVLIYQQIMTPIKRITNQIRDNQPLAVVRGLKEVREMAYAYNGLLRRRDTLDSILRSAAVTDALTNLPNRYAFQQCLVESSDEGYSLGVFLFDVNYLKKTNDTKGHAAGDELLRQSAECISSCFGSSEESNCFRLGGDEFAAVMKDPTADLINQGIERFVAEQQRRQISISWGYALASELSGASLDELVDAADKRMYEQKKVMHQEEE